ncbi:hypothetical protein CP973_15065 [Streptomyces albofaciens JCM 4342]|nr:hypothetical protein CP973_15065 [Streptomyces albofaciens JCM 4342]
MLGTVVEEVERFRWAPGYGEFFESQSLLCGRRSSDHQERSMTAKFRTQAPDVEVLHCSRPGFAEVVEYDVSGTRLQVTRGSQLGQRVGRRQATEGDMLPQEIAQ